MAYLPSISSRRNEKWLTLISMYQIIHKGQLLLAKFYYNEFEFLEDFCANPPFLSQKAVQCPIIGPFQVIKCPHPRENFQITVFFYRNLYILR